MKCIIKLYRLDGTNDNGEIRLIYNVHEYLVLSSKNLQN